MGIHSEPRSGYELTKWIQMVGQHYWSVDCSSVSVGVRDVRGMCFHGEMRGVEEVNLRFWDVVLERFRARRQEERIVLAPDRQESWAMSTELGLKVGVERSCQGFSLTHRI